MLQLNVSVLFTTRKEPDMSEVLKTFMGKAHDKDVASSIISLEAFIVDEDVKTYVRSVS